MSLPLVLAGPIVRRVDGKTATFWIALSEAATVEAWVWSGDQISTGDGSVQSGDSHIAHGLPSSARKWGEHFYTATVTAPVVPAATLIPGSLHSYDITISGHGGLREQGLLTEIAAADDPAGLGQLALGYVKDRLPTFVTPPATVTDVRLAHTSCRKPHGLGPDALSWLDDVIEANRNDLDKRPQQLFLTGDQIYADDVSAALLSMLQTLSAELLGYDEKVPMAGGAAGNTDTRVETKALPPLRRARLAAEVAKFSSTSASSHLIGFGEFVAMYLACWSPRVWRALPDRDALFVGQSPAVIAANHLTDFETALHGSAADWKAADVKAEKSGGGTGPDTLQVTAFARTVPKVARALANCATYMIFDDHEITDDWYISGPWRRRVLTSPLGRTILRNGLMAYIACQAPGNDPAKWGDPDIGQAGMPESPEHKVLDRMVTLLADQVAPTPAHIDEVDSLIGLVDPTKGPEVRFHYTVDGPRHRIAVLDTRTRRTYDSATRDSPPKLLGDAMDGMLPAGPFTDGREMLIVVSAAPGLFPRIFDALIQPSASSVFDLMTHAVRTEAFDPAKPKPAILGSEEWDLEGWGGNEPAFNAFLRRLGSYPRVVVLGGDVHFASSLVCDLWTAGDDVADSRILQCTSSAAHNEPSTAQRAVLRGQRAAQHLLQGQAVERLGWDKKDQHGVVVPAGGHVSPGRRGRLRREPMFVPARGWPPGTTLDAAKPPNVRYRIAVLRDERPTAEMGVEAPDMPILPTWDANDPIAGYAKVAGAHQALLLSGQDPVRLMVFRSNIGLVSFGPSPAGAGEYTATHAVMSPTGDGSRGLPYTHHTADLARSAAAPPPTLVAGG